jgi:hypothetical protein
MVERLWTVRLRWELRRDERGGGWVGLVEGDGSGEKRGPGGLAALDASGGQVSHGRPGTTRKKAGTSQDKVLSLVGG